MLVNMKEYVLVNNGNVIYRYSSFVKPTINEIKGFIYEVQTSVKPAIPVGKKVVEIWTIEGDKYIQGWELEDVTLQDTWHDQNYPKRIKIAMHDINTISTLQEFVSKLILWWMIKGLKHYSDNDYAYFYCNFIYEEHQSIIDQFGQYIVIESLE